MRITCLLNDVLFGSVSHHAYHTRGYRSYAHDFSLNDLCDRWSMQSNCTHTKKFVWTWKHVEWLHCFDFLSSSPWMCTNVTCSDRNREACTHRCLYINMLCCRGMWVPWEELFHRLRVLVEQFLLVIMLSGMPVRFTIKLSFPVSRLDEFVNTKCALYAWMCSHCSQWLSSSSSQDYRYFTPNTHENVTRLAVIPILNTNHTFFFHFYLLLCSQWTIWRIPAFQTLAIRNTTSDSPEVAEMKPRTRPDI
jgi:hypothetical protein